MARSKAACTAACTDGCGVAGGGSGARGLAGATDGGGVAGGGGGPAGATDGGGLGGGGGGAGRGVGPCDEAEGEAFVMAKPGGPRTGLPSGWKPGRSRDAKSGRGARIFWSIIDVHSLHPSETHTHLFILSAQYSKQRAHRCVTLGHSGPQWLRTCSTDRQTFGDDQSAGVWPQ